MFSDFINFVKDLYNTDEFIPLHEPRFIGNEKKYINETIDSTFVSSVGEYVNLFEEKISEYTNIKYAIAAVNGTSALHVALKIAGVDDDDEVITQSLTFIASCNAIKYCNAKPIFVDVEKDSLCMSPEKLKDFLVNETKIDNRGFCINKSTNKRISACLPMHTFGFNAPVDEIKLICDKYNIKVVEDCAESLGTFYKNEHSGSVGELGILSFNGNKIITTGGGGMILTNDEEIAKKAKHITTTAKLPHKWEFEHDETGFNYRLPNINAALGVAQLENIDLFIKKKRELADIYQVWGKSNDYTFLRESENVQSNYWLNTLLLKNKVEKEKFLTETNKSNIMTRPIWIPMHLLRIHKDCFSSNLDNTCWLYERIVNVPSSPIIS